MQALLMASFVVVGDDDSMKAEARLMIEVTGSGVFAALGGLKFEARLFRGGAAYGVPGDMIFVCMQPDSFRDTASHYISMAVSLFSLASPLLLS
jgi:hypothetical protein